MNNLSETKIKIKVVDLFCGIGGLTHGLQSEGLEVVAGIDNDKTCQFGFEYNNNSNFILQDIHKIKVDDLVELFGEDEETIKVLVGCAPCQPFSKLNKKTTTKDDLEPIEKFAQLIAEYRPDIVSMENVPGLSNSNKYPVFDKFLETLTNNGYQFTYEIVNLSEYGVPQRRRRLVLLASLHGKIKLIPKTHKDHPITVRDTISNLEPIMHGEISSNDPLHRSRKLSPKNYMRIRATPHNGGSISSWDDHLLLECHKRKSGKTFRGSVYGRMRWDEPGPTITTQCVGLGNGRFGHPEQDRAISLREAALLQTFPIDYKFTDPDQPFYTKHVAKFIGNAVPVRLGAVIAKSIKDHLSNKG